MAGPINAPAISRRKAFAIANQTVPGTAIALTSADCADVSSVNYSPQPLTTTDPRYTGSIHKPGDLLLGTTWNIDFEWLIHGPGNAVPAANAFIPGRILQSWGFTENRFAAGVASDPYTSGSTTAATLGTLSTATAQLYKGLVANFATVGAAPLGFAMIRDYTVGKVATLARNRTMAATGNYTIPAQLAYTMSSAAVAAGASITIWEDGHRLNFVDMTPTAAKIELDTAGQGGGNGYCKISGSFTGTLLSEVNEATPTVSTSTVIPPYSNGQQDIALLQLGGSSVSIDLGFRSAFPDNPNQTLGFDPGVIVESKRTASYGLYKVARTVVDFNALAAAQAQYPSQALWGLTQGNYVGVMIANQRFNYRTSAEGQDFITTTGDAWIDAVDKEISMTFPVLY